MFIPARILAARSLDLAQNSLRILLLTFHLIRASGKSFDNFFFKLELCKSLSHLILIEKFERASERVNEWISLSPQNFNTSLLAEDNSHFHTSLFIEYLYTKNESRAR